MPQAFAEVFHKLTWERERGPSGDEPELLGEVHYPPVLLPASHTGSRADAL